MFYPPISPLGAGLEAKRPYPRAAIPWARREGTGAHSQAAPRL